MSDDAIIEDFKSRLADLEATLRAQTHLESALRASEDRAAFMLRLSDALKPLDDPAAIQLEATRQIGTHLGVDRALYAEVQADRDTVLVREHYCNGVARIAGRSSLSAFDPRLRDLYEQGKLASSNDVEGDDLSPSERAAFRALDVRAYAASPILKNGKLVSILAVQSRSPRVWTPMEIATIQDVADRTWAACKSASAEKALQESEARFRQFANASSGALWVRNAVTMDMEYASPAVGTIYGVEPVAFLGDVKSWAAAILPEDRVQALNHLLRAAGGESVTHEFRIRRASDGEIRWIRDTSFPLHDDSGDIHRIGGIGEDITEAKLAIEHRGVLLSELQDRVRNIMTILRTLTVRTAERVESVNEYSERMSARLLALARVQDLLQRAGQVSADLDLVVKDELEAHGPGESQLLVSGPKIALPSKAAEVLTLAIHELAMNAKRYGALSVPEGRVTVQWDIVNRRGTRWVSLEWMEDGGPSPAGRDELPRGFGRELIEEQIPAELGGTGRFTFAPSGARCRLEIPLAHQPN